MPVSTARKLLVGLLTVALAAGLGACRAKPAGHDDHDHDHEHSGPTRKGPVTFEELGVKAYPGSKPWSKNPSLRVGDSDAETATLLSRVEAKPADVERFYADQLTDFVRKPTKDGCKIEGKNAAGKQTALQFVHEAGAAVRVSVTVVH